MIDCWKALIKEKKEIAKDTFEVTFEVENRYFNFTPGQYIWIELLGLMYSDQSGARRAFSIATSPNKLPRFSILFRNTQSGFKKSLLEMPIDTPVNVYGPFGFMQLPVSKESGVVFVAGGVGVAPFMSMLRWANEHGVQDKMILFYANSSTDRAVYLEELKNMQKQNSNFTLYDFEGTLESSMIFKALNTNFKYKWFVIGPEPFVTQIGYEILKQIKNHNDVYFEEYYPQDFGGKKINEKEIYSLEMFKLASDQSPNHLVITDINGKIIYANQAAADTTGYSIPEMLNQTPRLWGGLMPKEFYGNLWHVVKDEKKMFAGEIKNRKKNGEYYIADARISPIIDNSGALVGFVGSEQDITHQKHDMQHLVAMNKITKSLFYSQSLTDAFEEVLQVVCTKFEWIMGEIWSLDFNEDKLIWIASWHDPSIDAMKFITESRNMNFIYGESLPGKVWEKQKALCVKDLMSDPKFSRNEIAYESKLNSAVGFPVITSKGIYAVIVFYSKDIIELDEELENVFEALGKEIGQYIDKRDLEKKLFDNEKRFRALIENSEDVIVLLDSAGNIIFQSNSVKKVLGYEANDLLGKNFKTSLGELINTNELDKLIKMFYELLKSPGKTYTVNTLIKHKNGNEIEIELNGVNMLNDDSVSAIVINYREAKKHTDGNLVQENK